MKLVHTFIPNKFDSKDPNSRIIWKDLIYVQLLSVLLAKKIYGNIALYTNETIKEQIIKCGIPYDEIDTTVLAGVSDDLFSIPKLRVYEKINEPFVHIDTDTLIYEKIDFNQLENNIMFSHRDIFIPKNFDGYLKPSEIFNLYPALDKFNLFFKDANITYVDLFNKLKDDHSEFKRDNIRISEVPNMNIVFARNYESLAEASRKSLDHYYKNKDILIGTKNSECYIEQLMVHLNLMEIDDSYLNDVRNDRAFLLRGKPFTIETPFDTKMEDVEFPIRILQNSYRDNNIQNLIRIDGLLYEKKMEQGGGFNRISEIKDLEDIKNFFDFDFYGINHLTFYKWSTVMQAIVIGQIINNFGEEYVMKIHEYFKILYPSIYRMNSISEGEKLYSKLTGFNFEKNKSFF